jgi:4-aminobutyrate aminotransferase-like enzyme
MAERSGVSDEAGLKALRDKYVPRAYTQHHPIVAVRGEGAWIQDSEGGRYLDFAGGIGAPKVGQRHAMVVEALHGQVDRLLHTGPVMSLSRIAPLFDRFGTAVDEQDLEISIGRHCLGDAGSELDVALVEHGQHRSDATNPFVASSEELEMGMTIFDEAVTDVCSEGDA